ncbi:hypothetical protein [Pedobacter sp.]|jgi:hypothetical protein|uniref:hypothetical protein n=1 Tax=Pedobacter sp. TaxID=1411316 RepID=UPI002CC3DE19|nr:hypothetical protein [Pedobacter sp.]HWW41916.1 hypothetical protein [Pedobacter sp.]
MEYNQIIIGSELYELDYNTQTLIGLTHDKSIIPFHFMLKRDGCRIVIFDKNLRMIIPYRDQYEPLHPTYDKLIKIDDEVFEPTLFNNVERVKALNKRALASGNLYQLMTGDILLALRGKLPQINIEGEDYVVDVKLCELRKMSKPWERIKDSFLIYEGGSLFLYDTYIRKLKSIDRNEITCIPEGTVIIQIPSRKIINPVGEAINNGMSAVGYLTEYPFQSKLIGKRVSIFETSLGAYIKMNLERKAAEKEIALRKREKQLIQDTVEVYS